MWWYYFSLAKILGFFADIGYTERHVLSGYCFLIIIIKRCLFWTPKKEEDERTPSPCSFASLDASLFDKIFERAPVSDDPKVVLLLRAAASQAFRFPYENPTSSPSESYTETGPQVYRTKRSRSF